MGLFQRQPGPPSGRSRCLLLSAEDIDAGAAPSAALLAAAAKDNGVVLVRCAVLCCADTAAAVLLSSLAVDWQHPAQDLQRHSSSSYVRHAVPGAPSAAQQGAASREGLGWPALAGGRVHPGAQRRPAVQHLPRLWPRRPAAGSAPQGTARFFASVPGRLDRQQAEHAACAALPAACRQQAESPRSLEDAPPRPSILAFPTSSVTPLVFLAQVHLFDIDIPGRITFKESLTLTAGEGLTVVDTEVGRGEGSGCAGDSCE